MHKQSYEVRRCNCSVKTRQSKRFTINEVMLCIGCSDRGSEHASNIRLARMDDIAENPKAAKFVALTGVVDDDAEFMCINLQCRKLYKFEVDDRLFHDCKEESADLDLQDVPLAFILRKRNDHKFLYCFSCENSYAIYSKQQLMN